MSVKRYQVSGYEWELEEAGTRADVPVDEWPEVLVAATDFDAIASRLEEAERLRDQAHSHEDGYLQTIGKLEDNCCKAMDERDAAIKDADDMRAELRKHCGCEFEDIEIADRPRTATCLLHLEAERDAARYRFVKRRGWPSATRDGEGGRLWYMDREADNVEIVRAKFDDCVDAAMGPAPYEARP